MSTAIMRAASVALALGMGVSTLVGAGPASAAALDWRCTMGSHSTNPPIGTSYTNWVVGQRTNGGGSGPWAINWTRRYWLTEENYLSGGVTKQRFLNTSVAACEFSLGLSSVTELTPQGATEQPPCTAPGDYIQAEGGDIMAYRFIGERTSPGALGIYRKYRFWHKERQSSPGSWSYQASSVAVCLLPRAGG
ncbi:hypothetical protein DP939_27575 [Spongiactinospora rosea]|uniref:Uncharacterized protein n=1 Tax=Spongiactinospora rosea TaxID=2248750 RepID=A0A366LTG9_9ACTN|nr:hypothetical protein [Spongiactinospora rosea]RBQ16833.1 hypothetical protein DP939_27575 [Spongiactinospora rosea]